MIGKWVVLIGMLASAAPAATVAVADDAAPPPPPRYGLVSLSGPNGLQACYVLNASGTPTGAPVDLDNCGIKITRYASNPNAVFDGLRGGCIATDNQGNQFAYRAKDDSVCRGSTSAVADGADPKRTTAPGAAAASGASAGKGPGTTTAK